MWIRETQNNFIIPFLTELQVKANELPLPSHIRLYPPAKASEKKGPPFVPEGILGIHLSALGGQYVLYYVWLP